jgi:hypothetical protein
MLSQDHRSPELREFDAVMNARDLCSDAPQRRFFKRPLHDFLALDLLVGGGCHWY